ncbi:ABC transporter substrate-binding protein [Clostridium formicaceticum]|uniref:D-ribose-binding periplasmic protein n=1 Tax=Clostridium formicaceticum TaxID=1497 RepID=A0AAC9RFV8_9CLOT|nr:ABC transporter substrate-binding protein [Clostridium formicaceticum]AOY75711.1 LacI family transcriptional regulator [Clostridium formicaceticum]ARE86031.1 D-ribose-binding periplasmic protein precursor [Clostridium formicaceticum]
MSKKSIALLLVLLMSVMVFAVGCSGGNVDVDGDAEAGGSAGGTGEQLVIGMAFQDMNNPYFITMHEAFEEAAKSIGARAIVTDARHDVGKQTNDIEDMIQQGIDILLLNPADSAGIETAVIAAKNAGIIVVAVDAQANGPIDSFVGSRNYDAGYLAGKKMAEDLGGTGKVAILDGIPVVPILERVAGFKDAVAEYPGIEIVDTQNGRQERSVAMDVTENMLQAHADLDAIFSVNDGGALGTLAAIEASGRDVWIYSVDGHPEVIEAILEDGVFKATTAQFPRDQVRIGLGMALAKLWGAEVVPEVVPIDVQLQTIENAAGFSW